MFFKVVQNDVNQCLDQIKVLRVPDLVPTDSLEVQVKVCVALRAKLISEVKVNIGKLKVGKCKLRDWAEKAFILFYKLKISQICSLRIKSASMS